MSDKQMNQSKFPPRVGIYWHMNSPYIQWTSAKKDEPFDSNNLVLPFISLAEHNHLISQLEERLRVARDALIFYSDSDPDDYIAQDILDWDLVNNGAAIQDKGKRAREALAAIKEKK